MTELDLPSKVNAAVRRSSAKDGGGRAIGEFDIDEWVPRSLQPTASPFVQFAMSAATQALEHAGWKPQTESEQERTGVAIGSGIGSIEDSYEAGNALYTKGYRRVGAYTIPRILANLAAGNVSILHGLRGPNHTVSTACTTGAHAIGDAFRFVKHGDADVMVCGGTEAGATPLSIALFSRIRALSTRFNAEPERASRPFDTQRDGFVMGEGAGVLVLEELEHAKRRNAPILAEIVGYGLSGDAHHITQPQADGRGALLCMRNALREAGLPASAVDYINAHATSTPIGDAIEARAIKRLLTEPQAGSGSGSGENNNNANNSNRSSGVVRVSSTKGATGHMLGAAGAVEAAFTVLALQHGLVPPTLNLADPDPECQTDVFTLVGPQTERAPMRVAMTNSFGFGGTNASLVFTKFED